MRKDIYFLCGFINIFNVIPAFVTPVFKNKLSLGYFVQYVENKSLKLDKFTSDSVFLSNVNFYGIYNFEIRFFNLDKNSFVEGDKNRSHTLYVGLNKPIFGFQTEKEIVYGEMESFMKFLNKFDTSDQYLKAEIKDFIENIDKFKINECDNDKGSKLYDKQNTKNVQNLIIPTQSNQQKLHDWTSLESIKKGLYTDLEKRENDNIIEKNIQSYIEYVLDDHSNKVESLRNKKLLEDFDKKLKCTHYSSCEYSNLIKSIYELLFNNQGSYSTVFQWLDENSKKKE